MGERDTTTVDYPPTSEGFDAALDAYVGDLADEYEDDTENERLEDRAERAMCRDFE